MSNVTQLKDCQMEDEKFVFCSCMGPVYGEPYCPCEMRRSGLPRSQECKDAMQAANKRLQELFGPGGEYAK